MATLTRASPLLGVVAQIEVTRRAPFRREKRRCLGTMLRSVVHDVCEPLPGGNVPPPMVQRLAGPRELPVGVAPSFRIEHLGKLLRCWEWADLRTWQLALNVG